MQSSTFQQYHILAIITTIILYTKHNIIIGQFNNFKLQKKTKIKTTFSNLKKFNRAITYIL